MVAKLPKAAEQDHQIIVVSMGTPPCGLFSNFKLIAYASDATAKPRKRLMENDSCVIR